MSCLEKCSPVAVREKWRPLRLLGLSAINYIDDRASVHPDARRGMWLDERVFVVLTALGVYFSFGARSVVDNVVRFEKVCLWPMPRMEVLGFDVDIANRCFFVPAAKEKYIVEKASGLRKDLLADEEAAISRRQGAHCEVP